MAIGDGKRARVVGGIRRKHNTLAYTISLSGPVPFAAAESVEKIEGKPNSSRRLTVLLAAGATGDADTIDVETRRFLYGVLLYGRRGAFNRGCPWPPPGIARGAVLTSCLAR